MKKWDQFWDQFTPLKTLKTRLFPQAGTAFLKRKKHVKPLIDKHFTCFYWRRHPDSNWGIKILQTFALPLGYGALKNGAVDEARTRDLHLGKVALYQLSYYRI